MNCRLWGWGRNTFNELLEYPAGMARAPVELTQYVSAYFDPAQVKSIQGGTNGAAVGIAVMCTLL